MESKKRETMENREYMLKMAAITFGALAATLLMGYYVFEVLPATDNVRMYEIEQKVGLMPNY